MLATSRATSQSANIHTPDRSINIATHHGHCDFKRVCVCHACICMIRTSTYTCLSHALCHDRDRSRRSTTKGREEGGLVDSREVVVVSDSCFTAVPQRWPARVAGSAAHRPKPLPGLLPRPLRWRRRPAPWRRRSPWRHQRWPGPQRQQRWRAQQPAHRQHAAWRRRRPSRWPPEGHRRPQQPWRPLPRSSPRPMPSRRRRPAPAQTASQRERQPQRQIEPRMRQTRKRKDV